MLAAAISLIIILLSTITGTTTKSIELTTDLIYTDVVTASEENSDEYEKQALLGFRDETTTEISDILQKAINFVSRNANFNVNVEFFRNIVHKIIKGDSADRLQLMNFAFKLWNSGRQNIVINYFPAPFKLIFGQEYVTIVNQRYSQALKLGFNVKKYGDKVVRGDNIDKTSNEVRWEFIPKWSDKTVKFYIRHTETNMFLKLGDTSYSNGIRKAFGTKRKLSTKNEFIVEPVMMHNTMKFYLINVGYNQHLMMSKRLNTYKDRTVYGHGDKKETDNFKHDQSCQWIISAWY